MVSPPRPCRAHCCDLQSDGREQLPVARGLERLPRAHREVMLLAPQQRRAGAQDALAPTTAPRRRIASTLQLTGSRAVLHCLAAPRHTHVVIWSQPLLPDYLLSNLASLSLSVSLSFLLMIPAGCDPNRSTHAALHCNRQHALPASRCDQCCWRAVVENSSLV